jgi:hypothetical protein
MPKMNGALLLPWCCLDDVLCQRQGWIRRPWWSLENKQLGVGLSMHSGLHFCLAFRLF